MERERRGSPGSAGGGAGGGGGRAPGKRTLTEARYGKGPRPGGAPLPAPLRDRFASSLGTDLGEVRVHRDGAAAEEAEAHDARAFAEGNDIVLGAGEDPATQGGAWLLAHEVAHTVQQRGGDPEVARRGRTGEPGDAVEHAADRAADAMVHGLPAPPLAAAPPGRYRIPRHATLDNAGFGTPAASAPAGLPPDFHPDSTHWRFERALVESIADPAGGGELRGEFLVSRFFLDGRPAAILRDAAGQLALDPRSMGGDVGAMPQFIENHALLARTWGLRLLHNADGLVTHVVTPTPRTLATLRRGLAGGADPELAPAMEPAAATGNLDGQQFAQAMRTGAPPVSVVDPALYYHDWLQHMPGFLTLGRQTTGLLRLIGAMVGQLYAIAGQRAAGGSATLRTALTHAVDAMATNGALIEAEITYIGEQMARPTAQIDRAAVANHYGHLWRDAALTNEPATADRARLSVADQATFDDAIAEMRARRAEVLNSAAPLLAGREAAIAADVQGAVSGLARADQLAAVLTLHVAGRDLSLVDERGLQRDLEQLAAAHQLVQAQAEARAELARLQGQVTRGHAEAAAVAQYGSDASGAAVTSGADRDVEQHLPLVERLVARIEAADRAFGEPARVAYLARFEQMGLQMVGDLMARALARRSEAETDPARAHLRGREQRTAEGQLAAAQITAARAAVGGDFVWTDPQVYAALVAGANLAEHPIHRTWIEAEHARRQPPPESHTVRNVVLGSLVVLGLVTGTLLLAEAVAGAEATTVTAAAVFTTEDTAAAGLTYIRVVETAVVPALTPMAVAAEATVPQAAQAAMAAVLP